jgi:hypothetical protein
MIKFFRKIRQRLLSESMPTRQAGKFSKYLLYALGEIVLVVIGILIALQINNWNNERIENKLETGILKEILVNLERDVVNLNAKIEFNDRKMKFNQEVLEHLEQKTTLTDSLKYAYSKLLGRGTFEPITVAYENLKSKGIDIIHNDSLRIAISELYDFKYFYITQDLRTDYEPVKNFHMSGVFSNVKTNPNDPNLAEPVNLEAAQNNIYFHESIIQALTFYKWMNMNYRRGIDENKEVQQRIKRELGRRDQ